MRFSLRARRVSAEAGRGVGGGVLRARVDVVVEERTPLGTAARAVARRVDEDELAWLRADAEEVERLRAALPAGSVGSKGGRGV
jgi:hypothetical protein